MNHGEHRLVTLIRPRTIPENPSAHVVFVHGLDGDSHKTWLSGSPAKDFWPEWLEKDVPNIAVWSLGYEATSVWWKQGAALALPDRAASILPRLTNEPALQSGEIYFVTHSLGGLVVKTILRLAEARAPHSVEVASFLRRVRKIAFVGTPHTGSDQATLINRLRLLLWPRETTAGLSRNDPHLRDLNTWFRSFAATNGLEAIVLRETLRAPFLGIPRLGGIVVKADSADPGLSPATEIIPIVADHHGIVAPKSRDADVYQCLLPFISKCPGGQHRDTLLFDAIRDVGSVLEQQSAELQETKGEILAAMEAVQARKIQETAVASSSSAIRESTIVTKELDQRLWLLRKSRYILGYDAPTETRRLLADLGKGGELETASAAGKRSAFAWCARILAAVDLEAAEAALAMAQTLGTSDENIIAAAFIAAFRSDDAASGLAGLGGLRTPEANTASFLIAANKKPPAEALEWLAGAGLTIADLDSDGRFGVLQRRVAAGDIEQALLDAAVVTEADFEQTPVLLHSLATANLAAAIHPDLRAGVLQHLPIGLDIFPPNATPEAIEHCRLARSFYARSQVAFTELKQDRAANMSADYELWLALRDEASRAAAHRTLEVSMSDPKHRLRRLPMALLFGLKLDNNAVELELQREATRTGGKSADLAVARFAMARAQSSQPEVAAYIDRYRDQLTEYFNPSWILAIEVETLARSGRLDEARAVLQDLRTKEDVATAALESLQRIIDEEAGSDPIDTSEKQYLQSRRFPDLLNLFDTLKGRKAWPKLAVYGKQLFEQTHAPSHGIAYAEALYRTDKYADLLEVAATFPALAALSPFKHIQAWTRFRLGDVIEAKRLMEECRAESDAESTRMLESSIAIACGDWSALHVFVEDQWARRDELSAKELLRAGHLAQHIDSSRDRDLISEAARKANGDAAILVACYSAAFTAGWESKEEIHEWFATAVANSGEDGPIKQFEFRQIVDMAPDWNRRESDAWGQLLKGDLPMYAGAFLVNRSPVEMFSMTALSNLHEGDLRKRGIVFAYSGARSLVQVTAKCAAFDVSALLTLAIAGQLENAFRLFENIRLSHRTMGWLLEQRHAVRFHQPSRIKDAEELRRLVDTGALTPFEPTEPADVRLETEVGEDLAAMLVAASSSGCKGPPRLVVRPFPVHKPGSLMEEISDITGYEERVVDCASVVAALKRLGHMTEAEEIRARNHLSAREGSWPHSITQIPAGAELYLDGLAVSYLQYLGLLRKLKEAGFKAYVCAREISESDALLARRTYSEAVHRVIEEIRSKIWEGIQARRILLGSQSADDADGDTSHLTEQPTIGLFSISDADAFVIDDRFFNQHGSIDVPSGRRPIHTSLDLLEAMRSTGTISDTTFGEVLARLRRAGFLLIPILPTELETSIVSAPIVDVKLQEIAELRAIRESQLKARMIDLVQLPKESQWMDSNLQVIIKTLRRQWRPEVVDEVSRARSNWLAPFLDLRGWAHCSPTDRPQAEERRAAQILLLSQIPGADENVRKRYEAWFEDTIFEPLREHEPRTYQRVLAMARSVVEVTVARDIPDFDGDEE